MPGLFSPFHIKDLALKNRVVMAPMCMYSAPESLVTPWHVIHYATRAMGGVGLVIVEATGVLPEGRISSDDLGLWRDEQIPGMRELVDRVHACGAKIGIQLGHAGRKGGVADARIVAPSALAFDEDSRVPDEMDLSDISAAAAGFGAAARRALQAGFDLIEIHGAHGYLINQFLSPLTNRRTDAYGGSVENRSRFLREVVAAVRAEWPWEKPLQLRVSAVEYADGGNVESDVSACIQQVKGLGIDLVHVSSGGVLPVPPRAWPGYQIEMARRIREATKLPAIAGGMVTEPGMAEEIIRSDRADLVFLARVLLREPYWALHAARALRAEVEWPEPYLRGKPSV